MQVDPAFQSHRRSARRRRNRARAIRGGVGAVALMIAGGLGWALWPDAAEKGDPQIAVTATGDDAQMVQVAAEFDVAPVVRADTFTDLPGDPLILRLAEDDQSSRSQPLPGPPTLDVGRVGLPAPDRLLLVDETLHTRERRLMTALPSSPEDFALFQQQRTRSIELLQQQQQAPAPIDPLTMTEEEKTPTRAAASTIFLRPEAERQALSQDLILELALETPVADLLRDNGFQPGEVEAILSQVPASSLPLDQPLPQSTVVAIRYAPLADDPRLLQLSLYGPEGWQGSVARGGRGELVPAADPWIDDDIMRLARGDAEQSGEGLQYRLLDVIYSAAIRAEVPTEIVGEIIAMMAQVHDLGGYADPGDRLTLIYARDHGAGGGLAGQVLYAGVDGPSGAKPCYVVPREDGQQGFRCHAPGARIAQAGSGGLVMTMPVSGTIRRKFGAEIAADQAGDETLPGIEFAAARDAPVIAAAAGTVLGIDGDQAAGFTLTLDHGGGLRTRYSGLSALAEGLAQGGAVTAGGALGRVGRPAGGTEDGLFFQAFRGGEAINPMPFFTGGQTVLASNAVEALIGRIIRVESAGNPNARNPLSSASGLGQFIDSTWLRMMRSYRPELAATMSRQDLLNLRFNADLSREMVKHLAQENEAYLRARGHQISAGRLYLAHFLGPEGAHRALSAADDNSVLQVMGAAVVNANPFLRGYSIAQLKGWADRKMTSAPVMAATPEPEREAPPSPAVMAFVAAMDAMLAESRADQG